MKTRLLIFFYAKILFAVFILFSYLAHKNIFTQLDLNITVRLQDNISRQFDDLFSWFSVIGGFEIISIALAIVLILKRKVAFGIFALLLYTLMHLIEIFGKVFVDHLPPPHFLLRTEKLVDFPQFHVRLENSYPSGHSARAAFISIIIILLIGSSKKLSRNQKYVFWLALIVFDIVMFASRIYLGEHWTTDVVGGALLGFAAALFAILFI